MLRQNFYSFKKLSSMDYTPIIVGVVLSIAFTAIVFIGFGLSN